MYLYAADIVLEQSAGPDAGNVSGELASAPVVRGASDVAFSASDPGSGVYEAVFSVDGQVVQSTVVDENGGRCRNVGQTADGLAAFLYVRPCPASVSADVPFDTTRVSNGSHHLIVSVIDAAGNAAPVLDRQITVANPGAAGTGERDERLRAGEAERELEGHEEGADHARVRELGDGRRAADRPRRRADLGGARSTSSPRRPMSARSR